MRSSCASRRSFLPFHLLAPPTMAPGDPPERPTATRSGPWSPALVPPLGTCAPLAGIAVKPRMQVQARHSRCLCAAQAASPPRWPLTVATSWSAASHPRPQSRWAERRATRHGAYVCLHTAPSTKSVAYVTCARRSVAAMGVHGLWQLLEPAARPVTCVIISS